MDHADIALLEGTLPPGTAAAVAASVVAAVVAVADPPSAHPTQAATTSASTAIPDPMPPRPHRWPGSRSRPCPDDLHIPDHRPSIRPGSCYAPTQAQRHPHKDERRAATQLAAPDLPAAEPAVILIPIPVKSGPGQPGRARAMILEPLSYLPASAGQILSDLDWWRRTNGHVV